MLPVIRVAARTRLVRTAAKRGPRGSIGAEGTEGLRGRGADGGPDVGACGQRQRVVQARHRSITRRLVSRGFDDGVRAVTGRW
ncbi:hypothetical protein GCM10009759_79030 [Kitasatospora saccharophila]|uniref:Uncharacterized protein n=1 Tax=Kitasatospora saccharophila TaxID=407973 RepID=A0ABP5K867_9ACTN